MKKTHQIKLTRYINAAGEHMWCASIGTTVSAWDKSPMRALSMLTRACPVLDIEGVPSVTFSPS